MTTMLRVGSPFSGLITIDTDLDGDFGVLVGQFEGVVEDLEVFLQGQSGPR